MSEPGAGECIAAVGGAGDAWNATISTALAADFLRSAAPRSALVLTHARPDGDALGSAIALTRALRLAGIDASALFVGPVPRWAADLIADHAGTVATPHRIFASSDTPPQKPGDHGPGAFAVVDTGAWVQLESAASLIRGHPDRTIIIDHHLSGDPDMSPRRLIDHAAAAAAEITAGLCTDLLRLPHAAALPLAVAEPLYLGLATDTGWFRYSNTRPATLRLAADLREAGVDAPRLYESVEQQDRPARLRLLARALSSLELHDRDSIALMSLTRRDFDDCRGDTDDTTGFASDVLSVASVRVGILLTEVAGRHPDQPITKASLRSKPGPDAIDLAALTRPLGGGGHARAAGVKLHMPLPQAKAALLAALNASSPAPPP